MLQLSLRWLKSRRYLKGRESFRFRRVAWGERLINSSPPKLMKFKRRMVSDGLPLVALGASLAACSGAISSSGSIDSSEDGARPSPPSPPDTGNAGELGDDGLPNLRSSDGLRPLSRQEYVLTVASLLGVKPQADRVPLETLAAGHSKISLSQAIVRSKVESYYALGDQAALSAVAALDCKPVTAACATTFAQALLDRVFREVPDDDTRAHYMGILDNVNAGDTPGERLQTFIAAALSSPLFLYRKEIGHQATPDAKGQRSLTQFEIAERLAYLLWEAPPDEALYEAAEAGKLQQADARVLHLQRMLKSEQTRTGLRGFVNDWMGLVDPESRISAKNPEVLKNTPGDLEARAQASFAATVDNLLKDGEGGFVNLMNANAYVADATLANFLNTGSDGATSDGDAPSLRALDPEKRQGILLHPTVLAAHTGEGGASPFLLGKFIYENLLCGVLGEIPIFPAVDESALQGKTLRQVLEDMTAPAACQTCHAKIGPPGFAFLSYDVLGRHSPTDGRGVAYDTRGVLSVAGQSIEFANAPQLSAALATHPQTARCVAKRLFRWTFGRFEAASDSELLNTLTAQSIKEATKVESLLTALVRSDAFARVQGAKP